MKLHEDYQAPESEVPYLLDTGDGQFCEARMRASVAEEIVRTAESVEVGGEDGDAIVVNGRMTFPAGAFEFDSDELPRKAKPPARETGK